MGSSASNTRLRPANVIHQLPMQDPLRNNHSRAPRHKSPPSPPPDRRKPAHIRSRTDTYDWPLPPTDFDDDFQAMWPTDSERYSIKRAYDARAPKSTKKLKLSDDAKNKDFHQKETSSNQWKVQNSSIHDSAHVQSSLQTQSHACINLSTTQEIDNLLSRLNNIHAQIDSNVEERGKLVSEQTRQLVELIIKDTRDIQQTLLGYAKKRQELQDDLYNKWLQMYVIELDKWKSGQLSELQDQLQTHQRHIVTKSQNLITQVNNDANQLRDALLRIEQGNASELIAELTSKIKTMTTHQLGTETMTRINLVIHGNVGTKAPGQDCQFDFDHNNSNNDKDYGSKGNPSGKPSAAKPGTVKIVKSTAAGQKKAFIDEATTMGNGHFEDVEENYE